MADMLLCLYNTIRPRASLLVSFFAHHPSLLLLLRSLHPHLRCAQWIRINSKRLPHQQLTRVGISSPLDIRLVLNVLVVSYYNTIQDRRVVSNVEPGYLKKLLPDGPPEDGEPWADIQEDIESKIMPGLTHW
jgi:hypothetical protein